jgi:Fe-S-cluster containining protein
MTLPVTAGIVRFAAPTPASRACIALAGEIGQAVRCTIYAERPSPCREFDIEHAACNRARQRHGLPPL